MTLKFLCQILFFCLIQKPEAIVKDVSTDEQEEQKSMKHQQKHEEKTNILTSKLRVENLPKNPMPLTSDDHHRKTFIPSELEDQKQWNSEHERNIKFQF